MALKNVTYDISGIAYCASMARDQISFLKEKERIKQL